MGQNEEDILVSLNEIFQEKSIVLLERKLGNFIKKRAVAKNPVSNEKQMIAIAKMCVKSNLQLVLRVTLSLMPDARWQAIAKKELLKSYYTTS
ncbi:MAG: hypothetical protein LLG04_11210 [Parachlamydia sp.]|nr:hypothetical protein [Parachlamydia sp.]